MFMIVISSSYNGGKTIKVATEEVEVSQSVSKKNFDLIVDFVVNITFNPDISRWSYYP